MTICDVMEETAAKFGDRVALISDRETLTFREYDERANRYARWARAQGIAKGDAVALLMGNRPDYLCIWMGVARAGGVTALINTNLTGQALAHSIAIVQAKLVIVGAEPAASTRPRARSSPNPALWLHGGAGGSPTGRRAGVTAYRGDPLEPGERTKLTIEDRCLFIYTSGTTGLPKAANINHYRIMAMAKGFSALMDAGRRPHV